MPYFLADTNIRINKPFILSGDEANHIVLSKRAKIGERVKIQGPNGKRFICEILEAKKHRVELKPLEETAVPAEPAVKIVLFQSVVAQASLDLIFQKSVELGAGEVVLFNSANTATRLTREKFEEKSTRRNKILWEAAKQCERARIPELRFLNNLDDVIQFAKDLGKVFLMDIEGQRLEMIGKGFIAVGFLVGPEGGLTEEEIDKIKKLPNCRAVTLGPILLKAETVAIAGLAIISNLI
jgi:16S rRNA (uracil1498-N3)-methyltransferase